MWRVRHQLVVLDEIDAGFAERADEIRGLLGSQADAGFNDGADEGPAINAGEFARAIDAELRAG
jgi:hypothetical protein